MPGCSVLQLGGGAGILPGGVGSQGEGWSWALEQGMGGLSLWGPGFTVGGPGSGGAQGHGSGAEVSKQLHGSGAP